MRLLRALLVVLCVKACTAAPCKAGTYGFNGNAPCEPCPLNHYNTYDGSESCNFCGGDKTSPVGSIGVISCVDLPCAAGSFRPAGGTCTLCYWGTYATLQGQTACTQCPAGKYASTKVRGADYNNCINCPANTYAEVPGMAGVEWCAPCPTDWTSIAGSSACVEPRCPVGSYGPWGNCIACPAGSYSAVVGMSACAICPISTFSGVSGASSCQTCQANATSAAGSVSQAYCYCKSGYAHVAGSYTCRLCDPGTYNSQLGRMACSNCSVGLYSASYGATGNETCLACPLGRWSPEGSPSCNLCPANSLAGPASGSQANCICTGPQFSPGYTGPNGGPCSACSASVYTVQVVVGSNTMVSTADLQQKYSLMSRTVQTPQPLVLELPFELYNVFYFTDTDVDGFYLEMELVDGDGRFLDENQVAQADEVLTWHLADFFNIDASRVHFETIAPRFPMVNNVSNVRVWVDCDADQLAEMFERASRLVSTQAIAMQSFQIAGLTNAVLSVINGQMVDGKFVECKPNFIVDALTCKCQRGYRLSGELCVPCEAGTYGPGLDMLQCLPCGNATFSLAAATSCTACQVNSNSSMGSVSRDACQCHRSFFFDKYLCLPCVNGSFKSTPGNFNCSACLTEYYSSDALSCNTCNYGYAPNGTNSSVCVSCPKGAFKPTPVSSPCLSCATDTFSNVTAALSCKACPVGYKSLSGTIESQDCCAWNSSPRINTTCTTSTNAIVSYSATACVRFIALTPKPSFASISTRTNAAVGTVPTYNAIGGPNGKGHVSFDRTNSQFLDAGSRTLNIATNGGFTIVAVVRFTESAANWERIVDIGSGGGNGNLLLAREGTSTNMQVDMHNNANKVGMVLCSNRIVQNSWLTVVLSYRSSPTVLSLTVNGFVCTATAPGGVADRTASGTWMGRSHYGDAYLNADVAGVFVVDEFLSTTATTNIADAMKQGVDFTSTPCETVSCVSTILCSCNTGYTGPDTGASKGQCSACLPGTYKATNGSANCTQCPLNSNSAVGSQNITDCTCDAWCSGPNGGPCIPKNSTLNVSSGAYQCSPGYTGPDRTGPCVACAVGTYKNVAGPLACSSCEAGKYQPDNARTACISCAVDTFQNATASVGCQACPAGFRALSATTTVQDCCGLNSFPQSITICTITNQDPLSSILATSPAYLMTSAEAWDTVNSRFTDLSGNGRHGALTGGTVTVGSVTGNGAGRSIPFVQGTTSTVILWPAGSIPSTFTVCSITRYSGATQRRILQSTDLNWMNGHENGNAGATHYHGGGDTNWYSINPKTNWVVVCGRNIQTAGSAGVIVNGVVTCTACGGVGNGKLAINSGWNGDTGKNSDWQFSTLYVWDRHLSNTEFADVSAKLNSYVAGVHPLSCVPSVGCPCNTGYTGPDRDASKGQCAICPSGTYKPTNGSAACTSCPVNSNSSVGSTIITNCICNPGYTGPNGGPCPACEAGKFKNASGSQACDVCAANTYSASGVLVCTSCLAGFQSAPGSREVADCCDPNTTFVTNLYYSLSSATQAALSDTYVLRLSSTPMLGYVVTSASVRPTYLASDGYNGQAFVRFSKTSSTIGHQYLDASVSTVSVGSGLTIVTVVRFMENMRGMMLSMQQGNEFVAFEVVRSNALQFCVCALTGGNGCNNLCTDAAVPTSTWLQVSYTYNPSITNKQLLKVSYALSDGSTVVLSKTSTNTIYGFGGRKSGFGYGASTDCSGAAGNMVPRGDPLCDRANFDLAGFYFIQTLASDADVLVLLQAIATASQIAFDRSTSCPCNAGFGGSGRSNCASCAPGTYKSEVNSVSCSLCAANTYSTKVQALNVSTCLACPNNSVSVAGRFECECTFGYEGNMYSCSACVPGKYKRVLGTSACLDCPANMEARGFASVVCASLPGYNGLGYALDDAGRSCGSGLNAACTTLSNGATSNAGGATDGALDGSASTYVSVAFNPNVARSCGLTGTSACAASYAPALTGGASLANDGNTNTLCQTDVSLSFRPYWGVDFGQSRSVFAVNILSTGWTNLKDFKIVVGDTPDAQSPLNAVCADYLVGIGSGYAKFNCEDTVSGRYLYVVNGPHAANFLTLSEVTVESFNYTATPSLMLPWWGVDFEVERALSGVTIQTQASSVVQVRVGQSTDPLQNAICAQNRTILTGVSNNITCSSAMLGRYLFVIGTGNQVLVLNDVRVLGAPVAACAQGTFKPLVGNTNCTACSASSASVTSAAYVSQCTCTPGYLGAWS